MLVAGEASGDKYGALVIGALRRDSTDCAFFGIGGDHMIAEGFDALFHIRQTSFMGFVEVAKHWRILRSMFARCRAAVLERRPSVVVLIDYPGFNLRFAKFVRRLGIPVVYFISPQVWAWGRTRVQKMASLVNHLAVVFPFEKDIFTRAGIGTTFVGHPLLDVLATVPRDEFLRANDLPDQPLLGIFPGSRKQEIHRMLPVMLEAAEEVRRRTPCLPVIGAAGLPDEVFAVDGRKPAVPLLRNATYGLMEHAHAAIVTSGTATVETALLGTPMVICYRASRLNYEIGKRIVNVDHIGMPNILAGRTIVPELIQHDCTARRIVDAVLPYFLDPSARSRTIDDLHAMRQSLGSPGAGERVADIVRTYMRK